jgi:hypothetical protein
MGVTASVPVTRHQSIKLSYNNGAYIRYGGNYQNISVAWQYSCWANPMSGIASLTRPIIDKLAARSHRRQGVSAVHDLLV